MSNNTNLIRLHNHTHGETRIIPAVSPLGSSILLMPGVTSYCCIDMNGDLMRITPAQSGQVNQHDNLPDKAQQAGSKPKGDVSGVQTKQDMMQQIKTKYKQKTHQ